MPRLPTILVTGSHAISTSSVSLEVVISAPSPVSLVAGQELPPLAPPFRLLVHGPHGEAAQGADHRAVHAARRGGHPGAGRFVHERHELVGEARHRAGDADAADVRAAADP